ncbi:DUF4350 domain-containing protein [filamentous cyanobacterium CCP2]|nr:DUF4350 domain-containing protein [filamentous cyanobacterium CCP2]
MRNRWVWVGAIGVMIVLTLFLAPRSGGGQRGSTYGRAPSGYGAWYAYMQEQGAEIQRWEKPLSDFQPTSPRTLLQVSGSRGWQNPPDLEWVRSGNVVVMLGFEPTLFNPFANRSTVTDAPFTSVVSSPDGEITLQTSRRFLAADRPADSDSEQDTPEVQNPLSDSYGAIVQEWLYGEGKIIFAVTPHLAANAYQEAPGNFKLLERLVTEPGHPIWVDEYLHGYKDTEVIEQETSQSVIRYLAQTPLLVVAVQAGVILLVLIWSLNQRFGAVEKLTEPAIDNSKAYIQALAAVLRKANCSEFVVSTLGKAEQVQVQRSLGLGADLLKPEQVLETWTQQTGQPTDDLKDVLQVANHPRRLSPSELINWLEKVQRIHQVVDKGRLADRT